MRKIQKVRFSDPNARIKNRERVKKAYENPEYHQKQSVAKMRRNNPMAKPIICVETKHIYDTMRAAESQTGINDTSIGMCCNGILKTAGGFRWKFIHDITRKNGEFIPGAITLGIITEEEVLEQLKKFK